MASYAEWIKRCAEGATVMRLHTEILPCGHRMASEYRALLQDASRSHLHHLIRTRLAELEQTLNHLGGAKAA